MLTATILQADAKELVPLNKIRKQRESLLADIESIRDAKLPLDECIGRVMREIREQAKQQSNDLGRFTDPGQIGAVMDRHGNVISPLERISLATLWQVLPEEVERGLRAYLAPLCADAGLPATERPKAISKLEQQVRVLEAAEEAEVCKLEAAGYILQRRADANVDVLLEVWEKQTA